MLNQMAHNPRYQTDQSNVLLEVDKGITGHENCIPEKLRNIKWIGKKPDQQNIVSS
jgi:hypothetical protein